MLGAFSLELSAHLGNDFGVTIVLFLGNHVIDRCRVSGSVEDVGDGAGLGGVFFFEGRVGNIANGAAFGIDDVGQKGESVRGFFFGNIARTGFFDGLGGGNGNSRFLLAGNPGAFAGFGVEIDYGGKVSFHGLVFFDG